MYPQKKHRHYTKNGNPEHYPPLPKERGKESYRANKASSKSAFSYNLNRLNSVLSSDLLACALGVSERVLDALLQDKNQNIAEQYKAHLSERLAHSGLPSSWLWTPNVTLLPAHLEKLRQMAAQSANKAPLRRQNFLKLVKAFEDKIEILADALDIIPQSLLDVANGKLPLDEQRFGHFNPILARASFPDGWLEDSNAILSTKQIENLETLAADQYERELSEYADLMETSETTEPASETTNQVNKQIQLEEETTMSTENTPNTPLGTLFEPSETVAPGAESTTSTSSAVTEHQDQPSAVSGAGFILPRGVMKAARPLGRELGTTVSSPVQAAVTVGALAAPVRPIDADPASQTPTKPAVSPTFKNVESERRLLALDRIFEISRRGIKKELACAVLDRSEALWSAIRRGLMFFKEEWARTLETYLELPSGWLDNPTDPIPTLPAWAQKDSTHPFPSEAKQGKVAKDETSLEKTVAKTSSPKPAKVKKTATAASKQPVLVAQQDTPVVINSASEPEKDVSAQTAALTTSAASLGPIGQAFISTLQQKAQDGSFTEQDALRLLNHLMGFTQG